MTVLLLAVVGIFTLWSWAALTYVYSSGEHTGYVRQLARTGWVCKTWEGALVTSPTPGTPSRLFAFTVRNDSLARLLQEAAGRQVTLSYVQHIDIPSRCFGDTEYFIEGIKILPPSPVLTP